MRTPLLEGGGAEVWASVQVASLHCRTTVDVREFKAPVVKDEQKHLVVTEMCLEVRVHACIAARDAGCRILSAAFMISLGDWCSFVDQHHHQSPPPRSLLSIQLHQRSHPILALLAEAFLTNQDIIVPPFQPATVEMIAKMLALLPTATLSGLLRGAVALPLLSYAVGGPHMCCKSETEPPKRRKVEIIHRRSQPKQPPTHTCIHPPCSVGSMFSSHVHRLCIFIIAIIIIFIIIIIIIRRGPGRAAQATQVLCGNAFSQQLRSVLGWTELCHKVRNSGPRNPNHAR